MGVLEWGFAYGTVARVNDRPFQLRVPLGILA